MSGTEVGTVMITLTTEQARHVADYWIMSGPGLAEGGIVLETPERLAGTRAVLDEYEAKMEAIAWGKFDAPITLNRPRDEMVAVAAQLLDSGAATAPGWNAEWQTDLAGQLAAARQAISEMRAGLAIAEQIANTEQRLEDA